MQPRVTAVVVARDGAASLDRTLAGLRGQTRAPDRIVAVDAGSRDDSRERLAAASPSHLVVLQPQPFGAAVDAALHALPDRGATEGDHDDWLWLLSHDAAPHPRALAALLGTVEVAPSVAVAGPKVMRADARDRIARFGETLTRSGASVILVQDELDQGQHDTRSDVMGVSAAGMLVRRAVFDEVGGFDPGLPDVDAALDLCVRIRLAGHRVVAVPQARVDSAGGPESFGRRSVSERTRARLSRRAQLHRRLVYSPAWAVLLHWLSLVPLAVLRSAGHLLGKRPALIAGEFAAALAAAFGRTHVLRARRALRRARRVGWAALAPLRLRGAALRELRVGRRQTGGVDAEATAARPDFFSAGGAWTVLALSVVGLVAVSPALGAAALTGGGLLPLSMTPAELWANTGIGTRGVGSGIVGAADPFATVLAVLGTLTFWNPSTSVVALYLVAVPLGALGAWWCAARFSASGWPPAIAAVLWGVAPPLLAALHEGRLGAVITHVALPWLVLTAVAGARSWAASAASALLFAVVVASTPSLAPALVVAWIAWLVSRPRSGHRLLAIPLPAAVLVAPFVVEQVLRGTPLALLADPGVPAATRALPGWQLALGSPEPVLERWAALLGATTLPDAAVPVIVAALLVPLAALALLGVVLPGTVRAVPALVLAVLGFATAVAATRLSLATSGAEAVSVWPGAGSSLYWFGLSAAAVLALGVLGRAVVVPALTVAAATLAFVAPLVVAPLTTGVAVQASTGRILPAFVTAEARSDPDAGTLVLTPESVDAVSARIERGTGATLDDQSVLVATAPGLDREQRRLGELAGNLVTESGFDVAPRLDELGVDFVLLEPGPDEAAARRQAAAEALDATATLVPVGDTATGLLWRVAEPRAGAADDAVGPLDTAIGRIALGAQALVFALTLLLAVPTRRRRRAVAGHEGDETVPDAFETEATDD